MIKVGDIISIRVKVSSVTEEENKVFKYCVKSLTGGYSSMTIQDEDVTGSIMNVPKEVEEI